MIRLGVIGCGRILPAHLRGLREIKTRRLADFEITALCSRNIDDVKMFRSPETASSRARQRLATRPTHCRRRTST